MNEPILILAILAPILGFAIYYFRLPPSSCDLSNPKNRTFDNYYGFKQNYFAEVNAERDDNPFFEGVIPENLFAKNSFILEAKRGGGKTAIRKRYASKKEIKLELYNKQANFLIKNFVSNIKNELLSNNLSEAKSLSDSDIIINYWKAEHFEHIILYLFTESVLSNYYKSKNNYDLIFKAMASHDDKIQLSLILCLYAKHDKLKTLEDILNNLWLGQNWVERSFKSYSIEEVDVRTRRTLIKRLFLDIQYVQDKIPIIERFPDSLHTKPLELFFNIMEYYKFDLAALSKSDRLSYVLEFYKEHFKTTPCLIIDSLDEVSFFFDEKIIKLDAMKVFIKSALNHNILAKCYDGSIDLVYMFPKLPNLDIKDFIERRDKIPLLALEWKPSQLRNYADFVLQNMRNTQSYYCKVLPDFYTLVNYQENKNFINLISTPRELNIFMQDLIIHLNADSYDNYFTATPSNVMAALESSNTRMNN